MKVAAIVLAAGGSSRLGQPKQLLLFHGESLIRRVVRAAQEARCAPIVVVVGRDREMIARELKDVPVILTPNDRWERGLGTSIRVGVEALPTAAEAVVILACDQPHVDAALLRRLLETHARTGKPIVASGYAETRGIPALFAAAYFTKLRALAEDEGAKKLLHEPNRVATVPFPAGELDIDTPEDLASLCR